jgi:small-conductance mechanosensitive channel
MKVGFPMRLRTFPGSWMTAALLLALVVRGTTAAAQVAPSDSIPRGAPVVFQGDTLFSLFAQLGAFTPAERAAGVIARLDRLHRAPGAAGDSIVIVPGEASTDLVIGETVVLSILDGDAAAVGQARPEVAQRYAGILSAELKSVAARTSFKTLLVGALLTLLTTIVLLAALKLIATLVARLSGAIEQRRSSHIPALRIQRFEIVSASRITDFLLSVVRTARTVLIIVLLYFYVPLTLSFFPFTAPLGRAIIGYIATPLKNTGAAILGYLPNLFSIVVIVFVTHYVLKFIRLIFDALEKGTIELPRFDREWGKPTYKIVRFLVLAFVMVVIWPFLPGTNSEAFKGISLFFGALFTLGSSSAVSNIVAGTVLTYTRAFRIGDRIQLGDTVGDVIEKTLLVTRVRTIKNVEITVPNAQVLSGHIVNYSAIAKRGGLILHTTVTIGYDAPWRKVHELLIAAARSTANVLETPAPFVLQTSLDDFFVSYQLNAYTDQAAVMARTYSDLHQNIQEQFNEGGVEIMSPHYAALRDGNRTAIPTDWLPAGYVAPPFRVTRDQGA